MPPIEAQVNSRTGSDNLRRPIIVDVYSDHWGLRYRVPSNHVLRRGMKIVASQKQYSFTFHIERGQSILPCQMSAFRHASGKFMSSIFAAHARAIRLQVVSSRSSLVVTITRSAHLLLACIF